MKFALRLFFMCSLFLGRALPAINVEQVASTPSIIYVYLGDKIPGYLVDSIPQTRLFNKSSNIFFIGNASGIERAPNVVKTLQDNQVQIVLYESLEKTEEHLAFEKVCRDYSINFYYKSSTERFYCIDELMTQYNLTDVFQVEGDVMVYFDFHEYLPLFQKHYKGIAAPFECDHIASVSFFYIANTRAIREFVKYIPANLPKCEPKCDMLILAAYKNDHSDIECDHLPTISDDYIRDFPLITSIGQRSKREEKYWNHIDEWNSFFDCDWIGTLLVDRYWFGTQSFFYPDHYCIRWERDELGRKIPYAYYCKNQNKYRLNTLHVFPKKMGGCMSIGGYDLPPWKGAFCKE